MSELVHPKNTKELLRRYGFLTQKKYGQNFLIDEEVLERIVSASGVTAEDFVLEIGPGIGTMTQRLCETAREVVAVEIDEKLLPILDETLSAYSNVTVLHRDILKTDLNRIAAEKNNGLPIAVVANLPYYITTAILMSLFEAGVPLKTVTVMVQKEVADRMIASPGKKDYGALSLAVQYYSEPKIICSVPPSGFLPQPKVESTVIRLEKRTQPAVQVADEAFLFRLIRASFNHRRKTLVNALMTDPLVRIPKEEIQEALKSMELPEAIRGEALQLSDFAELSNLLL